MYIDEKIREIFVCVCVCKTWTIISSIILYINIEKDVDDLKEKKYLVKIWKSKMGKRDRWRMKM